VTGLSVFEQSQPSNPRLFLTTVSSGMDNGRVIEGSLCWVNDEGREQRFALNAAETLLGRKAGTDVTFSHQHVSRHHAKIKKTERGYLLLDLASVHGTFVNGQPIEHHILRHGDRIRLADYQVDIRFFQDANKTVPPHASLVYDDLTSDSIASLVLANETTPPEIAQVLAFEYRAELVSSIRSRKVLESELALAHETQESLLPHSLPTLQHLQVRAFSKPTRQVGGDFYDFFHTKSGELVSILVDVSGKGVAASLLSSMILGFIQAHLRSESGLEQILDQLNRFMCERSSGGFATMFVCVLDQEGNGRFINAGHNSAYLFKPVERTIVELSSNNTIVGAFEAARYDASSFKLDTGDVLLIYSDGLNEAENPKGEMLGEDAIRQVVLTEAAHGVIHLENRLLKTLHDFTHGQNQSDDITIVIIERIL
jgi:serine phosphatase RsbU (regulator of sigma subunit)